MAPCQSCGSELPEAANFCPVCGARVGARAGEERKIVTVLFADLVDSTARADERDPEYVRAAVRPQVARMREELERFGGTFEKYVGDAVMAVFGAPIAHEDDPERAVRAALAIRDALPGVRVAVATGEAVVSLDATPGTGEGIATGDVVNTAFRIEEAAASETVLVGESTYRATQSSIEYGERRLLQARGKAEPVAVYEALRATADLHATYEQPPLAPLVGRKEELSLVLDTLARARRDRTVQLVTLTGVPGIGKSRLVWELQRALESERGLVTWRRGRCLPYGDGVTFWALGEMIKAQAGILETDDAATTETKLRRAVRDLVADPREAEWVEGHLRPLVALDAPAGERREEAFAAWRRLFETLAAWGPLVLVFEDLHWADEGLLDFLDHLADWATNVPLVLLCTARPELRERRTNWGARANAATVALPPLNHAETGALVGYLLKQTLVPAELQQALLERAEGNPLYAEEFVRMLVERGFLYRNGGGWQLREGELPLPESVQGIIAARIDALLPDEKRILQDASVIGRGFWPGAVAAVTGVEPASVERTLRGLERKELIRRLATSAVAGELQYSFRHALVRDVAYGQIPHAERSRRHLLAAAWIESLGRREDHAETLAHHYLAALEFAEAGQQDLTSFAAGARAALREAGDRALALSAFTTAAKFFQGALELWPDDDGERPVLLFCLGKSLSRSAAPDEEVLAEARDALLAAGDVERAAECDVIIGELLWRNGQHAQAFERMNAGVERLKGRPASYSRAFALSTLSRFQIAAEQAESAMELASAAMQIAEELELDDLRAHALNTVGTARATRGDRGGLADLERSIEIAVAANSPESIRGYFNLGSMQANFGDLGRAAELYAKARGVAERYGDASWTDWLEAERAYLSYWAGEWDAAVELADSLVRQAQGGGFGRLELDGSLVGGWIALARGEVEAALADAERAHAFSRVADDPQNLYPALAFRARALLAADRKAEAARALDELLALVAAAPSLPSFWVFELAVALVKLDRGAELADATSSTPSTRWLEAALAYSGGELVRAADICAEIGALPEEAYARLAAADAALNGGRAGEAAEELARALAFYRRVGASAFHRDAEALIARS
jgi:class 3 adenylate cyclase/tetratricopeptide (TPR) repeat protein